MSMRSIGSPMLEGEVVPGIPIEETPGDYKGPDVPFKYKVPFEKNINTGFLETEFMTKKSNEGYRYFKMYGESVSELENKVKDFQQYIKKTNSPKEEYITAIDTLISNLTTDIETKQLEYNKLEKRLDDLEPYDKSKGGQVLLLLDKEIKDSIEQLDKANRIKAQGLK